MNIKKIIAYGVGKSFYSYLERLDACAVIYAFGDGNRNYHGKHIYGDERICLSFEEIIALDNRLVLITVDVPKAVAEIKEQCKKNNVDCMHAREFLQIQNIPSETIQWPKLSQRNKIHRFIDLNMHGTTMCNFHCEYCYVWRVKEFETGNVLTQNHTVADIRNGLSKEKLGGTCFINMCARGETMLSQDIVLLITELLKEGHYVSVVTNGTVTKRFEELLTYPESLLERLFIKFSFHYKELERTKMMDIFWENVKKIKDSPCSYTLEVTPGDGTIDSIPQIKKMFEQRAEGAMPHISFTRDSSKVGFDLLSEHSEEEYKKIWGQFDSKMFDLKSEWYGKNMTPYHCYAGNWSYLVNILTGDIKPCYRQDVIGNIYDPNMKHFPVVPIDHECHMSYCFNNHAFLAWGCVPEIDCYNYLDMRTRQGQDGKTWVKFPVSEFMSQKLEENNYSHIETWNDYVRLFETDRKDACIILNSPDYPNLGDHAIALSERAFLEEIYPDREVIEISCEQYMKEMLRVKSAIRKKDILFITGGGYLGSLWLRLNDMGLHMVETFPENQIVVMPHSIYFDDTDFGENEKNRMKMVFSNHPNLLIAAREKKTYCLLKEMFSEEAICLVPDMALQLKQEEKHEKNGVLLCMREDSEAGDIDVKEIVAQIEACGIRPKMYSTMAKQAVYLNNREEKVTKCLNTFASAKLVITNRLHAMIFSVITGTPCIVFDNLTGKVSAVLEELENHNVNLCTDVADLKRMIEEFLNVNVLRIYNANVYEEKYCDFAGLIKEREV